MTKKQTLHLGFNNVGYQLAAGIHEGQAYAKYWLERLSKPLTWRETDWLCCKCGQPLKQAIVPAPVWEVIWECPNGHEFCYENTD